MCVSNNGLQLFLDTKLSCQSSTNISPSSGTRKFDVSTTSKKLLYDDFCFVGKSEVDFDLVSLTYVQLLKQNPQHSEMHSKHRKKNTSGWWFQIFFYFHPYLGRWSNLTNIFQMGWNHQLDFQPNTSDGFVFSTSPFRWQSSMKRHCTVGWRISFSHMEDIVRQGITPFREIQLGDVVGEVSYR